MPVITAKDITPPVQAIAQTVAPGSTVTQPGAVGELQAMTQIFRGVTDIFREVKGIVQEVKPLIEAKQAQQNSAVLDGSAPKGSPAQISSGTPHAQIQERVVQVAKKHNPEQIKALLRHLIVERSGTIPDEVRSMKIGDILGDKFATLQFRHEALGLDLNGEQLLHIIASGIALELDQLQEAP